MKDSLLESLIRQLAAQKNSQLNCKKDSTQWKTWERMINNTKAQIEIRKQRNK